MFNKTQDTKLVEEIKTLKEEISNIERLREKDREDYEIKLQRKEDELELNVKKQIQKKVEEVAQIKSERDNYKNKVEILEKAFENLGFDVKDMKSILDKLVDGLIAKNEIKLVK